MLVHCELYLCDINRIDILEGVNLLSVYCSQYNSVYVFSRQYRPVFEPRSFVSESNVLPHIFNACSIDLTIKRVINQVFCDCGQASDQDRLTFVH